MGSFLLYTSHLSCWSFYFPSLCILLPLYLSAFSPPCSPDVHPLFSPFPPSPSLFLTLSIHFSLCPRLFSPLPHLFFLYPSPISSPSIPLLSPLSTLPCTHLLLPPSIHPLLHFSYPLPLRFTPSTPSLSPSLHPLFSPFLPPCSPSPLSTPRKVLFEHLHHALCDKAGRVSPVVHYP